MDPRKKAKRRTSIAYFVVSVGLTVGLGIYEWGKTGSPTSINQNIFAFVSVFLWLNGSICFAQSKGYSQWYGALGFFWFAGLLALILLPDKWLEVEQQTISPTNYPRHPQG